MEILLLNLPEAITVFAFLSILFYGSYKPSALKFIFSFLFIFVNIITGDMISNELLGAALIIILSAAIWTIITKGLDLSYFFKSLLTIFICLTGMLVIQIWVPIYIMLTKQTTDILKDTMTQFYFSIPCRIMEYIILVFIYVFKIKPILAAKGLTAISKGIVKPASIWWVYTPKMPKGLRK